MIKSDQKKATFTLSKKTIYNKCCCFELSIHQRTLKKYENFHKNIKDFFFFNIRNNTFS